MLLLLLFSCSVCLTLHLCGLSITNPHSLFKLMSTEPVMPSNHLILCRSLLLLPLTVDVILAKAGWGQWCGSEAQAW